MSQKWLQNILPNFIIAQNWPSGCLNLSLYSLWQVLEKIAYNKLHQNLNPMKLSRESNRNSFE